MAGRIDQLAGVTPMGAPERWAPAPSLGIGPPSWPRGIRQLAASGGPKCPSPTKCQKSVNSEAHLLWEKCRARAISIVAP